jgi:hypothetical protein
MATAVATRLEMNFPGCLRDSNGLADKLEDLVTKIIHSGKYNASFKDDLILMLFTVTNECFNKTINEELNSQRTKLFFGLIRREVEERDACRKETTELEQENKLLKEQIEDLKAIVWI